MRLLTDAFSDGGVIPDRYAFCNPDPEAHATFGPNRNPDLAWEDLPEGIRSLVVICHDPDAPSQADDVNQEGRTVPADLERVDFYHWVLVDLDPAGGPIREGEFSGEVTPGGKDGPEGPRGTRSGLNDYTAWFEGDEEMEGEYFGYDGPCPPWNDEIPHRYVFTLYALDVARAPVEGVFRGPEVREAIADHVLAEASVTGTYTLNPELR